MTLPPLPFFTFTLRMLEDILNCLCSSSLVAYPLQLLTDIPSRSVAADFFRHL